ncbi:hypothetical protein BDP55DRAFT_723234 [Colletotrichum godetiae]|uniref:Uncharacterized protein n=1 Tax=Colletotrichum godetiae TaxID=1209918 RepID=A0AAJ0B178_9PEZI|nr:uncharacterized protein BDP55DRAFT_723234 [Colletotrichum godetiae]KAK1700744.1 hypothetical protein BDP55DRAFT_723234 [Colletotrichum godetiae]
MKKGNLTPKTITAPLAAFTMACILFADILTARTMDPATAVRLEISNAMEVNAASDTQRGKLTW